MMAKRKISLGDLAEKIDLTPANLSILKTGKAKNKKTKKKKKQKNKNQPFLYP